MLVVYRLFRVKTSPYQVRFLICDFFTEHCFFLIYCFIYKQSEVRYCFALALAILLSLFNLQLPEFSAHLTIHAG